MGSSKFLNLAFILALLLTVSVAQSSPFSIGFAKATAAAPDCATIYGVKEADTCFGVTQKFGISTAFFTSLNPNLNCDELFVGQWLCVSGSA